MHRANLATLTRYLLVVGAVVLLAPYAGCHILTTPPASLDDFSGAPSSVENKGRVETTRSFEDIDATEKPHHAGANDPIGQSDTSTKMDELETLLQP